MHSSSIETEGSNKDGGEVLVTIATLVTEGRIPGKLNSKSKNFFEGPHCTQNKQHQEHKCDLTDSLCTKFSKNRETVLKLYSKNHPLCIEVVLNCGCKEKRDRESLETDILLEQWFFKIHNNRSSGPLFFNLQQLISAIRSQLYFSQITAWLTTQDENVPCRIEKNNLSYRLTIPGETFLSKFSVPSVKHEFPLTDVGNGYTLKVTFLSLPRMSSIPNFICPQCLPKDSFKIFKNYSEKIESNILDDRMHTSCTLKGKHRCEDLEEFEGVSLEKKSVNYKRHCQLNKKTNQVSNSEASTSKLKIDVEKANSLTEHQKNEKRNISPDEEKKNKSVKLENGSGHKNDLISKSKGQLLLDAIERCGQRSTNENDVDENPRCANKSESDNAICDMSESDIFSIKQTNNFKIHVDNHCDSPIPHIKHKKLKDISNGNSTRSTHTHKSKAKQKITFEEKDVTENLAVDIPSPLEQAKFRKNLDNAASMVFHSRTGLPLTSSPAPVRRGKSCFDFDSSINSVSAIKSALFSTSFSTDDESESDASIVSPCSPEIFVTENKEPTVPVKYRRKGHAANLLGSFEESVLNGRLEPVSTVHGFRAELGASGSFVPKHLVVPVTVFFYTLGDSEKVSSPYLSHINLGKKGYNVPKSGTVQVTLFNPLGTVVKMFVIMYDLSDMPPNSQTFIRQRTLYMPTNCKDENLEWGPKWLRFLIHLRFMSSKSGKIYLHSDIRMIIIRKSDMDTATAHGMDMSYELRSFTHMPSNPRFSPRK